LATRSISLIVASERVMLMRRCMPVRIHTESVYVNASPDRDRVSYNDGRTPTPDHAGSAREHRQQWGRVAHELEPARRPHLGGAGASTGPAARRKRGRIRVRRDGTAGRR